MCTIVLPFACSPSGRDQQAGTDSQPDTFQYYVEQFADLQILRYQVPGFNELSLNQKKLVYYLSEAGKYGRDIIFDQNNRYNLTVRRTLENIVQTYQGDRSAEAFGKLMLYTKRVWFSNGIHHHYSSDKFMPEFSESDFRAFVAGSDPEGFPVPENTTLEQWENKIIPVLFDPSVFPKKVSQSSDQDIVLSSASNYYEGVTEKEVSDYYEKLRTPGDSQPISYGLNSKVIKVNGAICEKVWKSGGMYGAAIDKILFWLEKAATVAESDAQKALLEKLMAYYRTGDLKLFDEFNILWVKDTSAVDFVNGFTEVYGDPLGIKGSWESVINFKNVEATRRTSLISQNAQWFEDHSPIEDRFKKKEVKGVSAKVITAAQLGGDSYPSTAIGINLPNADWIRKDYGSKSVTIENITYAYDQVSAGSGLLDEFAVDEAEKELSRKWGSLAGNLHTDLHECLGHGSGQLLPGVSAEALKNYHSPLEEARADLFALYYLGDPRLVEIGLIPVQDVAWAEYSSYLRVGLITQLSRIEPGKDIQQAHMRCRKLISEWCLEKGTPEGIVEKVVKEGKTYVKIHDMQKLRALFGKLLNEIQRIKSTGDYEAGKALVENYGVKVDPVLHQEVLDRYARLNIAPYSGFINPVFKPVMENGEITDVLIEYPKDYIQQHLDYSREYSVLPDFN
ncbi:MAG: dihydrofolate reductase [Bacteroidales bacterium]|nr:dihydrofolate reductase [Bacteroidales bacterium]